MIKSNERFELQETLQPLLHGWVACGVADIVQSALGLELLRVQHVDREGAGEVDHRVRLEVQESLIHREGCHLACHQVSGRVAEGDSEPSGRSRGADISVDGDVDGEHVLLARHMQDVVRNSNLRRVPVEHRARRHRYWERQRRWLHRRRQHNHRMAPPAALVAKQHVDRVRATCRERLHGCAFRQLVAPPHHGPGAGVVRIEEMQAGGLASHIALLVRHHRDRRQRRQRSVLPLRRGVPKQRGAADRTAGGRVDRAADDGVLPNGRKLQRAGRRGAAVAAHAAVKNAWARHDRRAVGRRRDGGIGAPLVQVDFHRSVHDGVVPDHLAKVDAQSECEAGQRIVRACGQRQLQRGLRNDEREGFVHDLPSRPDPFSIQVERVSALGDARQALDRECMRGGAIRSSDNVDMAGRWQSCSRNRTRRRRGVQRGEADVLAVAVAIVVVGMQAPADLHLALRHVGSGVGGSGQGQLGSTVGRHYLDAIGRPEVEVDRRRPRIRDRDRVPVQEPPAVAADTSPIDLHLGRAEVRVVRDREVRRERAERWVDIDVEGGVGRPVVLPVHLELVRAGRDLNIRPAVVADVGLDVDGVARLVERAVGQDRCVRLPIVRVRPKLREVSDDRQLVVVVDDCHQRRVTARHHAQVQGHSAVSAGGGRQHVRHVGRRALVRLSDVI